MQQSREFQVDGCHCGSQERGLSNTVDNRTTRDLRSLVSEIMDLCAAPTSTKPELERLLGSFMKQEVDLAKSEQRLPYSKNCGLEKDMSLMKGTLQLKFLNKISQPVFTGLHIKGEDGPLIVALVVGHSGDVVRYGPEASARVKIVVLEADFDGCEGDSWTPAEFKSKIVAREGKKHVLVGHSVLDLKEGLGSVGDIHFPHTRVWTRRHDYRLGVIAEDDCIGAKIRPGITESFVLKDRRLDCNKKHHPPTPDDAVYQLDGIARDGAFPQHLSQENINTVGDLLTELNTNPQKLREAEAVNLVASAFQQLDKVVSFDDEASLFDKSLGLGNVICPPKSPITEGPSGPLLISQKMDEDLSQPAVSFEDKTSLFDDSPGITDIMCPPKSPIRDSTSLKIDELDSSQPLVSSEDEPSLFNATPVQSNIIPLLKSPTAASSSKIITYPNIDVLELPQTAIYSQENIPSCDSVWDINYCNDYYWQYVGDVDHRPERSMSFSSQLTDSDNWDTEAMNQLLQVENHDLPLQFSVDDVPLQSQALDLELPNNPRNNEYGALVVHPRVASRNNARGRYLRNKARRKWRVLVIVIRWLSVCKNAAGNLPGGQLRIKLSSSCEDLQSAGNVENECKQDFVTGTSHGSKTFQIFNCQCPLLSRNLSKKSEDNLHSAVNDILRVATTNAPKRYLKGEKARRRWTKLYSVMRWFSVKRDVTSRVSTVLTMSDPSCSSSMDTLACIWAMNSTSYDSFISSWDASLTQQKSLSSDCQFHEDEYARLFNSLCSIQPHDRLAMNMLARRRRGLERNFARKKWRLLFSIMKWLSVRRKMTRTSGPYINC